jgi:hypothetical protein
MYLNQLDFPQPTLRFTIASPTPNTSTVPLGDSVHFREEAYSTDSEICLTLIGLAVTT